MRKWDALLARMFANEDHAAHPELEVDEVWVGNQHQYCPTKTFHWDTERLGSVAYDVEGRVVPDYVPIFIKRSEYENALAIFNLQPS